MTHRRVCWIAGAWLAVLAIALGPPAIAQSAECTGNGKISKEIARTMHDAQAAMKAHRWEETLERISDAEMIHGRRTAFDLYMMGEFQGYVLNRLDRIADAARTFEMSLDSPCLSDAKRLERLKTLAGLYFKLDDHVRTVDTARRALDISRDTDMQWLIAQSNYRAGFYREAVEYAKLVVDSTVEPVESQLMLLLAACLKDHDKACAKSTVERLLTEFPKPEYARMMAVSNVSTPPADPGWRSLFNGKDLDGWTPKIAKHPVGENYADTFRVEDGVIKVSYDKYGKFDRQFGHLYSNQAYSNYILQLEYKFVGTAIEDSPPWAKLNSGVMIHSQSPLSMSLGQEFPASMEFQFLATGTTAGKQTGNVCTPGTNLEMGGKLLLDHIIDAKSKFYPLDEWVSVEAEVHGNKEVIYRVNGTEVLRYQRPQLDPRDADAQRLLAAGAPLQLSFGHIALQAESQPVWFRNIRIKQLDE